MAADMAALDTRWPYLIAVPPVATVVGLVAVAVIDIGGAVPVVRQFPVINATAGLVLLAIQFTAPAWLILFLYALYKDTKAVRASPLEWNPSTWQWLLGGLVLSPLVGAVYLLLRRTYVGYP